MRDEKYCAVMKEASPSRTVSFTPPLLHEDEENYDDAEHHSPEYTVDCQLSLVKKTESLVCDAVEIISWHE